MNECDPTEPYRALKFKFYQSTSRIHGYGLLLLDLLRYIYGFLCTNNKLEVLYYLFTQKWLMNLR